MSEAAVIPIARHREYRPVQARFPESLQKAATVLGFDLPTIAVQPGFTFHYMRRERQWGSGLKRGPVWFNTTDDVFGATLSEARASARKYAEREGFRYAELRKLNGRIAPHWTPAAETVLVEPAPGPEGA